MLAVSVRAQYPAVFLIPVGIVALPAVWPGKLSDVLPIFLLLAWVVITGFSVGLLYVPALVILFLVVLLQPTPPRKTF